MLHVVLEFIPSCGQHKSLENFVDVIYVEFWISKGTWRGKGIIWEVEHNQSDTMWSQTKIVNREQGVWSGVQCKGKY